MIIRFYFYEISQELKAENRPCVLFLSKSGTALLLDLDVIRPVNQPVPGKGNFFLEPLAKVGAGEKYQLFGQIGLDHGPEWFHGKFTGISTEFTAPTYSRSVFIANDANNPVNTKAVAGG